MNQPQFTVIMDMTIENQLDELFSGPADAIEAIDQINKELPILHKQMRVSRFTWFGSEWLKVYRGHIDWAGIDFTYAQVGNHLHILDCWEADYHRPAHKPHCVLPYPVEDALE